ncbi:MAG: tryptophan--tRNA ligase, partial [Mollicutes bacterium]|nr:tryptophan--tRNA ligase [Mollicutes bacterium]
NLMTIYSELTNKTISEVEDEFKDQNYGTFKKQVAETVVNFLTDLQKKYKEVNESGLVDKVLDEGKEKSTKIASIKYEEIRRKVGVGR